MIRATRLASSAALAFVIVATPVAPALADTICTSAHSGNPRELPMVDPYEKYGKRKLEKLAAKGDAKAYGMLGILHGTGRGVDLDSEKSFEMYRRGAELGDANSQANLAYMYLHGEGTLKDPALAFQWAKKSADAGYMRGQEFVGYMLGTGEGAEENLKEAAFCYLLAAKQGSPQAQDSLANVYEMGYGIPSDYEQSQFWRQRARQSRAEGRLIVDRTPIAGIPAEWDPPYEFLDTIAADGTVIAGPYSFVVKPPSATYATQGWERFQGKGEPRTTVLTTGLKGYDSYVLSVMPKSKALDSESPMFAANRLHADLELVAVKGQAQCVRTPADRLANISDKLQGMFAYCVHPKDREIYEIASTWQSLSAMAGKTGTEQLNTVLSAVLESLRFK